MTGDFPKVYACYNRDEETRKSSSSGGIFYLIAKEIIEDGGVVFGAAYNEKWQVEHSYAENLEDVKAFMGSKYVQSRIGEMYKKAEQFLKSGRKVLFSGTPCQIEGLKCFLNKEYDNLFTTDLICHGVPSALVWKKYLEEMAKNRKITFVSFRDKTEGWKDFSLKIGFEDGSFYQKNQRMDIYMKGFLRDICLRPSCYECKFKSMHRVSDVTMADYWGVEELTPEMFDDLGTSVCMINSMKGEKMWMSIRDSLKAVELSDNSWTEHNKNVKTSVARPKKRDIFYLNTEGKIVKRIKRMTSQPLVRRCLGKCKRKLKKLIGKNN